MEYVLYHNHCNDGMCAAHAVWLDRTQRGITCRYVAMYPNVLPKEMPDCTAITMVDVSCKRPTMLELAEKYPGKVLVIDHHESARLDCMGLDFCKFDMTKCGAVLTWEYYHGWRELPVFHRYINDRDLNKNKLPHADEIAGYINSMPRTMEQFDKHWIDFEDPTKFAQFVAEGAAIARYQKSEIADVVRRSREEYLLGVKTRVVNQTTMQTEVCMAILEKYPDIDFALCYMDTSEGYRRYSMRCREKNSLPGGNLLKLAENFGGGGHPCAAGFMLKKPHGFFIDPSDNKWKS